MGALNMIFYTAVTLGILIFVHELGHFIAAKLTGMRVDRFSIGFPPRAFGKKIGDTDYCISWLPLGGYVKIAGMVDESMDTDFIDNEPRPWEFRTRPMWARITVISAGVIMNVVLAVGIFTLVHYVRGKDIIDTTEIGYVRAGSASDEAGLKEGDRFLSINGHPVTNWEEVQQQVYIENMGADLTIVVGRNRTPVTINLTRPPSTEFSMENLGFYIGHSVSYIQTVIPGTPAGGAGIQSGDTITSIAGTAIRSRQQVFDLLRSRPGRETELGVKRADGPHTATLVVNDSGKIGVGLMSVYQGPLHHVDYSPAQAAAEGAIEAAETVRLFILTITKIVVGEASVQQSFGGPIAIAQLATQSAEYGLMAFLWFMAQLSMSLAILNILPIPALDGGHLVVLIIEKILRREIPHRVKIAIQQVGFILLLGFMAFIIYNDISRF
ncbi:MAG TPA: RIP metalloprotease RseP [Bacteroidota bacterium]|nr:RIP metalloprotease RseP [Bacteroidota bacterium]